MRTIKLVIIGDSGVGKTSLRSSYVLGRFSTGYRATIGTDFITKVLSHHNNPEEAVTLQIWDTAGQERFSSLSTAFFRGADAVLMMYDVNKPQTLHRLKKWWKEFQERAPVSDEDALDYCCVVVGNKIDLAEELEHGRNMLVSEEEARKFLEELIPSSSGSRVEYSTNAQVGISTPQPDDRPGSVEPEVSSPLSIPTSNGTVHRSNDITGENNPNFHPKPIDIRLSGNGPSISRATSRSRLGGTMTTTHTSVSIYHTPSSSIFDEYVSAPSSPLHSTSPSNATARSALSPGGGGSRRRATTSTTSSSDTITPSLFERQAFVSTAPTPPLLDRGPRLFLTSAKSGQSVPLVFEYIARRVVSRWEWEESVQDRTFDLTERPSEIRTVVIPPSSTKVSGWVKTCCS